MAETRKARSADPGPRRQAREAALQVLYALDAAKDHEAATVLAALRLPAATVADLAQVGLRRIGDDALQRAAGRRPVPDSFTHGTSQQRQDWFFRGYRSGDPGQCDTFRAQSL